MSAEIPAEPRERPLENPFYVLALPADCSRAEVERAGQKLLAMLEIDLRGAGTYETPFGPGRRDAAKVREAMAALRDPQRRLFHELWVLTQPWASAAVPGASSEPSLDTGFVAALSAMGWRS